MFTTREIVYSAVVPAALSLLILAIAWRPWRRTDPVLRGHWGGALAAGASFLAAYALLDGEVPAWPPAQSRHWLFYAAIALTVLGVADAALHRIVHVRDWVRGEAALVVCALLVPCLFRPLIEAQTWPPASAVEWVVGMVVALHLAWASTELLVGRLPRAVGPAVLLVFCAGAALTLMLSGSIVYGRLAGVMAVVAGAGVLTALPAPGFSLARCGVSVLVPITVAIIYLGHHLSELDTVNASLLLTSLFLPWLGRLRVLSARRTWVRAIVAVLLVGLPVGAAVTRAAVAFHRAQQQESGGLE
jgi:hypothetical protein